jgi:hypothetical protein
MLPTIKYNINVTDAGGAIYTTTVYPKADNYVIKTDNSTFTLLINVPGAINSASYDTLNFTEPDVYHIKMQLFYYDVDVKTNYIQFWVKNVNNNTYMNTQNTTISNNAGPVLLNYTITNNAGEQWRWGYDAHKI